MDKSVIINTPHGRLIVTKLDGSPTLVNGNFIIEIHREIDSREHKFQVCFLELTKHNIYDLNSAIDSLLNQTADT